MAPICFSFWATCYFDISARQARSSDARRGRKLSPVACRLGRGDAIHAELAEPLPQAAPGHQDQGMVHVHDGQGTYGASAGSAPAAYRRQFGELPSQTGCCWSDAAAVPLRGRRVDGQPAALGGALVWPAMLRGNARGPTGGELPNE